MAVSTNHPAEHVTGVNVVDHGPSSDEGSSSGPYRDSFGDDEEQPRPDYIDERTRRTLPGRILSALGMPIRHRRAQPEKHVELDYFSAPSHRLPAGLLRQKSSQHRDVRRCRRSKAGSICRKVLVAIPVLFLVGLGVLRLLEVLIGRASLFWDIDRDELFLPDWGKPGHVGAGLAKYPTDATRDVIPIPCHSHNDYWRRVPLFDAIHWGCTGVEADVWLFDEELFVGHNTASLTRNRTFRNLYVNPLVELLDTMNPQNEFTNASGHGVFDEDPSQTLVLLIDFKTGGRETFPYVEDQLSALREKDYLSYWDGTKFQSRAVTVVGTGNTPFDMVIANTTYRDIFFDAPLDKMWEMPRNPIDATDRLHAKDVEIDYGTAMSLPADITSPKASGQGQVGTEVISSTDAFNTSTSYYASVSFTRTVGFVWRGHLSPRQMEIIRGQVRGAKRRGLKARYWDTPSWPIGLRNHVWHVLMKEGADVLNVDDLRGAATENWKYRVHGFWR